MDVLCGEARLMRKSTNSGLMGCFGKGQDFVNKGEGNGKYLVGLEEKLAKFYVAQIVLVLEYLHKNGIVYRDLKPENVLVDEKGFIKLGDFGFAKNLKNSADEKTSTFCGTPGYVAPENVFTQGYSYSVDFWSLGVLTYVLLTGKQPFNQPKTTDPMVVVQRIVDPNWEVPYPPYLKPAAMDFIQQLLQREWQKRLGCRGKDGFLELKMHKWFRDVPWEMLAVKKFKVRFIFLLSLLYHIYIFRSDPSCLCLCSLLECRPSRKGEEGARQESTLLTRRPSVLTARPRNFSSTSSHKKNGCIY